VLQLHLIFIETLISVRLQGKLLLQLFARLIIYGHSHPPSCDGEFYIFLLLVILLLVPFVSAVSHKMPSMINCNKVGYHTRWFASWRWDKFGECNVLP
jgi:hypothetical protein